MEVVLESNVVQVTLSPYRHHCFTNPVYMIAVHLGKGQPGALQTKQLFTSPHQESH